MRFFFYGTLTDPDVRRAVIGPRADRIPAEPAWLDGYRVVFMRGRPYPVLARDSEARAAGVLARGLDRSAAALIDAFETTEYRRGRAAVVTGSDRRADAWVYFAAAPDLATDTDWRLEDWQQDHKPQNLRRWVGSRDKG